MNRVEEVDNNCAVQPWPADDEPERTPTGADGDDSNDKENRTTPQRLVAAANDNCRPDHDHHPHSNRLEYFQQRRRLFLVIFSSLYTFLYVGAFFGWGPMQLLMEDNGSFSSKCNNEADTDTENGKQETDKGEVCSAQTSALVNVSFIAQTTQFVSPFLGQIADHYGPAAMACLMALSSWIGLSLLIFGAAYQDYLIYLAFVFIALSSWMGGMLTVRSGMMYAEDNRMRPRIIILLNSLFDAGSITYLGLWGISEAAGPSLSLAKLITGYFCLSVLVFGGGIYFWLVSVPENEMSDDKLSQVVKEGDNETTSEAPAETEAPRGIQNPTPPAKAAADQDFSGGREEWDRSTRTPETSLPFAAAEAESSEALVDDDNPINKPIAGRNDASDYVLVCTRTQRQQLTSEPFFMLLLFWTISVTSNMWVLVTTRDFLAHLGDDEKGNKYLTIFTIMMPVSLVAVPFTDETLHKIGFGGAFQAVNILALVYNLIRTTSSSLNVQVVGFIVYSFFRSFLFGVCFSYLPRLLAPNVVSKATGVMFAMTGLCAFVNIALSDYAIEKQDGDFFIPNLIYTFLVLPCIFAAWRIGKVNQREARVRQLQRQSIRRLRTSVVSAIELAKT